MLSLVCEEAGPKIKKNEEYVIFDFRNDQYGMSGFLRGFLSSARRKSLALTSPIACSYIFTYLDTIRDYVTRDAPSIIEEFCARPRATGLGER